jgi:hypothetical protein
MVREIADRPKEFGFSQVHLNGNKARPIFYEGPAVLYPEFEAKFAEEELIATASVTVCVPPHCSKIWFRISRKDGKNDYRFDDAQLEDFFSKSTTAAEHVSALLFENYAKALRDCSIDKKLEEIHKIKIEASEADLSNLINLLDKDTFRMSMLLEDEELFRQIAGFLSRTFKKGISEVEAMRPIPREYKWAKLKFCSPEYETIGLYSKHHEDNETSFSGLVHKPSEANEEIVGPISKMFSRKLVQYLSASI